MFREMRRKKQALSYEETENILKNTSYGVLAADGDDGPYAVALNYLYEDGCIYFHCAKSGHKLDAVKKNPKVSFCVVEKSDVIKEKYTTNYKSAVIFGIAEIMEDKDEIMNVITAFAKKYYPEDTDENRLFYINREIGAMCMVKIKIRHMTGKQGSGLVK